MDRSHKETWDGMLPGPPSRSNGGAADLSFSGLLAYATGCSVAVVDSRSMQLVSVVPLPPPSSPGVSSTSSSSSSTSSASSLSPYVTSVRWSPQSLRRDILSHDPSSTSHLILAAGDLQGRISLLDLRKRTPILFLESENSKAGIQDLCWIQDRHDSRIIAALSGPSLLSLYDVSTGRCFFKYDASPELFSCIRLDPFDSRHFCVLGLKGFVLSILVLGQTENDVVLKELKVNTDYSELQKLEAAATGGSGTSTSTSPALAVLPTYLVRFAFSPHWRNILFVAFPRELVVFDLQYETALAVASLPRGFAKFLDVVPDPNLELLYCVHIDGKLSTWRRKEDGQVHIMCTMEELVPSIGTPVPSPSVLVVALSQIDSTFHNIVKLNSGYFLGSVDGDFDSPLNFDDESLFTSKTRLLCITDDGKIWNWILTAQGPYDVKKNTSSTADYDSYVVPVLEKKLSSVVLSVDQLAIDASKSTDNPNTISTGSQSFTARLDEMSFKISLSGQLSLLSSTVTILAVPSPSLTATLGRGGNDPAAAVPLVALGTQIGVIDVIDVSANAVAASFAVHSTTVRGLRWLGNSKLVSFSYIEGNERTGGFTNKLVVTCLRSGINRPFRVFQKPERTPIRALRTSSSGRYLLILFRDAPVEVWAMTKTPVMLRSLALPFTVLEWTLPSVPRPTQSGPSRQRPLTSKHQTSTTSTEVSSPKEASSTGSKELSSDGSQEAFSETFAFALANGALGVFEVQGRKIRDFRPKWPASSFVTTEGLITAMAYRIPHVVMGDRSGSIRWWDVTTGQSSSFNSHRDGIRRIKFSPVVPGDRSRGRIAVLFYDNTFSVFDLDSPDPLANSLLQPQFPGTLVLELDWLPLRMDKNDPLVLCIAGADSSFRMFEININENRPGGGTQSRSLKERYRPTPLCCPVLLPTPHALALRMILQLGVKPAWFNFINTGLHSSHRKIPDMPPIFDLRDYIIDPPPIGDFAAPEMLLKVLEPYRKEGCIFDDEKARVYASIVDKGCTARFAFAAATFGDSAEALFWFKLHDALNHLMNKLANKSSQKASVPAPTPEMDDTSLLNWITLKGKSASFTRKRDPCNDGQLALMAFGREDLLGRANERISWHDKLGDDEAIQNRVHELVSVGNFEMAVSLLLSTHPESSYFYPNALRAVALSAAVSRSLLELAVKVVAANMVGSDRSMSGTHLLCAVGRYQEACSQLQDAGYWDDAATLAATYLTGSDYIRVMQRWAGHVLHAEHNIWRALILYVEAGALPDVLTALRDAQQPDTAAMFILACREIYADFVSNLALTKEEEEEEETGSSSSRKDKSFMLPGLDPEKEEVIAVGEYFGQYQRKLIHLCMDSQPFAD